MHSGSCFFGQAFWGQVLGGSRSLGEEEGGRGGVQIFLGREGGGVRVFLGGGGGRGGREGVRVFFEKKNLHVWALRLSCEPVATFITCPMNFPGGKILPNWCTRHWSIVMSDKIYSCSRWNNRPLTKVTWADVDEVFGLLAIGLANVER